MKITYVVPHSLKAVGESDRDFDSYGGYPHMHCRLMHRVGWEAELVILTQGEAETTTHREYGHEIRKLPVTIGQRFGCEFSIPLIRYLIQSDSDLLHIRGYRQYNVPPFIPYLRRSKPVVVHHLGRGHTYTWWNPRDTVMLRLIRTADRIISITESELDELKKVGFNDDMLVHLPNALEMERFYPMRKAEAAERLDRDPELPYVVYVGRIIPKKNVPTLVDAMARVRDRIPNARLLIVGGGHEGAIRAVDEKISVTGLQQAAERIGHVDHDELVYYYNLANVCAFPSEEEGNSMATLEAFCCRTPLVATTSHLEGGVLEREKNSLVSEPDDVEGMATNIVRILRSRRLSRNLAENGYRIVNERFQPRRVAEETKKLYEEVHSERRNGNS